MTCKSDHHHDHHDHHDQVVTAGQLACMLHECDDTLTCRPQRLPPLKTPPPSTGFDPGPKPPVTCVNADGSVGAVNPDNGLCIPFAGQGGVGRGNPGKFDPASGCLTWKVPPNASTGSPGVEVFRCTNPDRTLICPGGCAVRDPNGTITDADAATRRRMGEETGRPLDPYR